MDAETHDLVVGLLREADVATDFTVVGEPKKMGFSGALILEIEVGGQRLVVKRNSPRLTLLPADASEVQRQKALRDDFSFGNEVAFLRTHAALLEDAGIGVPRPLHIADASSGVCCILMEARSAPEWAQFTECPAGPPTRALMRWLARYHAAFLPAACGGGGRRDTAAECDGEMWRAGTHTALFRHPAAALGELPQTMRSFAAAFEGSEPYFASEAARAQGERLRAVAPWVSKQLHPSTGSAAHVTMVHGDAKQANIFFREGGAAGEGMEVSVIDWQWAGPGFGATDLAYACALGLSDGAVEALELEVLRPYHAELLGALGEGGAAAYPYDALLLEFKLSLLDFQRWLGSARLPGFTPEKMAAMATPPIDPNRGVVLRSLPRMTWLWKTVDAFLPEIEERCAAERWTRKTQSELK